MTFILFCQSSNSFYVKKDGFILNKFRLRNYSKKIVDWQIEKTKMNIQDIQKFSFQELEEALVKTTQYYESLQNQIYELESKSRESLEQISNLQKEFDFKINKLKDQSIYKSYWFEKKKV